MVQDRFSRKVQQAFQKLKKEYWGRHFWRRCYLSATSGNTSGELAMNIPENTRNLINSAP